MKKFTVVFSVCLTISGMLFVSCQKKNPCGPSQSQAVCKPCGPNQANKQNIPTPSCKPNPPCKKY